MFIYYDNIIFSLQKAGGISVVWSELLSRIIKCPIIEQRFIEYSNSQKNIFRKNIEINENRIDVENGLFLLFKRFMNIHIERDSIFLFHSSYYRICSNKNAINITTVHDFTYEYFVTGFRKRIHCWQKYRAIRNSEIIICISENTKQDLIKFLPDVDAKKIYIVHNGVSDSYCQISHDIVDLPYEVRTYLLFVGGRTSYKNYKLALDVVTVSDFNFVIVGADLTDEEKNELNMKLGKHRYCHFKNVSDEKLNRLYNGAFALLYLSSYEGFGIPVLEAQKAGCPVIAYNSSSIPEIIGTTELLIDNLSVGEVLNRISLLKGEKRETLIKEGLKNANCFSWDSTYLKYRDIYEYVWNLKQQQF